MDINDKLDVIIMGLTTGPRLFNIVGKINIGMLFLLEEKSVSVCYLLYRISSTLFFIRTHL